MVGIEYPDEADWFIGGGDDIEDGIIEVDCHAPHQATPTKLTKKNLRLLKWIQFVSKKNLYFLIGLPVKDLIYLLMNSGKIHW